LCGYELLPHAPYPPDLAPSDFFLIGNLKKFLHGKRFEEDSELISAVEGWFGDQESIFLRKGIEEIQGRWIKCADIEGDCVEK
jgi:histone-lysine N-methyltransferase SETMAR